MPSLDAALVHYGGHSTAGTDCRVSRLSYSPERPPIRQPRTPGAGRNFVQDGGARIIFIELARTDNLVEGYYWSDRRAAKDEKYRPLR